VYAPTLLRLHDALKTIDRRSKFLRGWYLLWESVHQTYIGRPMPHTLDFLADALRAFPDDAEIQLAAGARWELAWVLMLDNPRVDPRRPRAVVAATLARARDHLRRSLALDASDLEARLRLIRVLLESNDVDGAAKILADGRWVGIEPAFAYLARLFEGAIRERQGDYRAAAQAYGAAIPHMAQAQSARVARSHLAHLTGARAEAAALALDATSSATEQNDPWWVYSRGLTWRVENYLERQRHMVRR
jgi:Tetratricopeptide repeat